MNQILHYNTFKIVQKNSMSKLYRKLPHIDRLENYQFVTIRTHDSLDSYLKKIESLDILNAKKQMHIDNYLDNSKKGRYFDGEVLEYFRSFLLSLDKKLFELVAFSIMPNHLHRQIRLISEYP